MILRGLQEALRELDLDPTQPLCIFSDISKFGIPKEGRDGAIKNGPRFLCESYLETLESVIGKNGTLLMPAFTYSACKGKPFNVSQTPSTVGVLTEYFRKQPGVQRSKHPIFSFSGKGPLAKKLLSVNDFDCFGRNSLFGKMIDTNGSYLLFGSNLENSATFVYYTMQKMKVDYRFNKEFPAVIESGEGTENAIVSYYVRDLEATYEEKWNWMETTIRSKKIMRQASYEGVSIFWFDAKAFDEYLSAELRKSPHCLISQPSLSS